MRLSLVYQPVNQADEYYVRDLYNVPAETAKTIVEDFESWTESDSEGEASLQTYQYENTDAESAVAAIDFRPVVMIHGG